ncbi:hypothetical protein IWX90DRAFT_120763 [Phyllosticta citrichinensis]|uniref:Uncharacterized protein n=1 Tax=Phyllosticta citrichinensis TaxID=1130410 RepID=A0ABR1Y3X5_9PEZI
MSDSNNSPPRSPPLPERRRSSFAGQAFADIFGRQPNGQPANNQSHQGPISAAAAQANRRRLSLTTLGLSGSSPNTASSITSERSRGASISSATSASVNESPFDDDDVTSPSSNNLPPNSPFARRLSFGARALRDSQQGNGSANANGRARPDPSNKSSPPSATTAPTSATKGRGLSCSLPSTPELPESQFPYGFSFAENMRTRAERHASISSAPGRVSPPVHQRAKSVATMEPPIREMPKTAKAPDAFQERILKGDFYMD